MISEDKAKEKLKKLAKEVNVDLNDTYLFLCFNCSR